MAQHDYVISNGTGAAVRSDLNNALSAIVTQNSGSTEPTTTYAYQMWADTNAGVMKIRNGANSAWITLYQLDGEWTSIAFENGSAAAPSIYFKDSGTDTGFFSGGTDQVNIATAGTERVEWGTSEVVFNDAGNNYDFRVEGDTNANLLFVDASADAVGIGTSSPNMKFTLQDGTFLVRSEVTTGTSNSNHIGFSATSAGGIAATISSYRENANEASALTFNTWNGSAFGERMRVSASGLVGIGVTDPGSYDGGANNLVIYENGNTGITIASPSTSYGSIYFADGTVGNQAYRGVVEYNHNTDYMAFYTAATEKVRLDSSGRLLVGTSTGRAVGGSSQGTIQIEGTDYKSLSLANNTNDTGSSTIRLGKSRGTSNGSNTIVQSGDSLGAIRFAGADGVNLEAQAASIEAYVDATPGAGDMPGRLVFSTTADGASSPTVRYTINSSGEFVFDSNAGLKNTRGTSYNAASNAVMGLFGATNSDSVDGGRVYNIEWRMSGNSNGQFWYANYITNGGSRTLGAYCTGTAWTNSSDVANKENIANISYGLNTVLALRPVNFDWKTQRDDDGKGLPDIGFIAQEMEQVIPEVVTGSEGSKGISYGNLVAVLTKAIQEQQVMITELQAKVAALESA